MVTKKTAQMTVFIVLGLVLLAVVSMAIYLRMNIVEDRIGNLEEQIELSTQRTALNLMVDSCLRNKAVKAIEIYGIDESAEQLITNFIEYEILPCIDVSPFIQEGIRIYNEEGQVTTEISDNAVAVVMHLPLTLVKEDSQATLENFAFTLQKVRYVTLPTDDNGKMLETFSFTTPNNRAEITIPENTVVKRDNTAVDSEDMISLRLVDRNYNSLHNSISIGEIMYLMEKGITFSPAATLTIYYNEDELPPWEKEEDLTLSIYNEDTGIWEVLPSIVEVDKNRIVANIEHFSLFTVTSSICSDNEGNDQTFSSGLLFKERCRECTDPSWVIEDGKLYAESEDVQYYNEPKFGKIYECTDDVNLLMNYANADYGDICCHPSDWDGDDPDGDGKKNEKVEGGLSEGECDMKGGTFDFHEDMGWTCLTWDPATPETYGYEKQEYVGGTAEYIFYTVEESGDVCSNDNTVQVEIDIRTSEGDQAVNAQLNDEHIMAQNFLHGENILTYDYENTNGDACAESEVVITIRGAGFLPTCPVGKALTENCVCGQQNVKHNPDVDLFCCDSGIAVDHPLKCEPKYNICPINSIFLGAPQHGCFCGGDDQQYNHYSAGAEHYCCGETGLSAEPCNSCSRDGKELSADCLCGSVNVEAGKYCCYLSTHQELGDIYMPQDAECEQSPKCAVEPGVPQTTSAVIMDITGMTIQAGQMCSQQNVGWTHNLWRQWLYNWCIPPDEMVDGCPEGFGACTAFQLAGCSFGFQIAGGNFITTFADYVRCLDKYGTEYVEWCVDEQLNIIDFPMADA